MFRGFGLVWMRFAATPGLAVGAFFWWQEHWGIACRGRKEKTKRRQEEQMIEDNHKIMQERQIAKRVDMQVKTEDKGGTSFRTVSCPARAPTAKCAAGFRRALMCTRSQHRRRQIIRRLGKVWDR